LIYPNQQRKKRMMIKTKLPMMHHLQETLQLKQLRKMLMLRLMQLFKESNLVPLI